MTDDRKSVVIRLAPGKITVGYLGGADIEPPVDLPRMGWSYYSDASDYIQDIIREELGKKIDRFIVDLTEATFVVSTDMGAFVTWHIFVRESGGHMHFASNERIRGRFKVTGLLPLLGDYSSVAEAEKAFESG